MLLKGFWIAFDKMCILLFVQEMSSDQKRRTEPWASETGTSNVIILFACINEREI